MEQSRPVRLSGQTQRLREQGLHPAMRRRVMTVWPEMRREGPERAWERAWEMVGGAEERAEGLGEGGGLRRGGGLGRWWRAEGLGEG